VRDPLLELLSNVEARPAFSKATCVVTPLDGATKSFNNSAKSVPEVLDLSDGIDVDVDDAEADGDDDDDEDDDDDDDISCKDGADRSIVLDF